MLSFVNHNGRVIPASSVCIAIDNRSFRYGDGLFETMRLAGGKIMLPDLHMERLFRSLDVLHYDMPGTFTPALIVSQTEQLAAKNGLTDARARLTIYRGEGSLALMNTNAPQYFIEVNSLDEHSTLYNTNGLKLGIFREAVKAADKFSMCKTNNFLCYALAARWATQNHLDDSIVLNPEGKVSDTSIANVFAVVNGIIKTPALSQGCVAGVMRQYLLRKFRKDGFQVEEISLSPTDILQASEVFLTNALRGIQWVQQVDDSRYNHDFSAHLRGKYFTGSLLL